MGVSGNTQCSRKEDKNRLRLSHSPSLTVPSLTTLTSQKHTERRTFASKSQARSCRNIVFPASTPETRLSRDMISKESTRAVGKSCAYHTCGHRAEAAEKEKRERRVRQKIER